MNARMCDSTRHVLDSPIFNHANKNPFRKASNNGPVEQRIRRSQSSRDIDERSTGKGHGHSAEEPGSMAAISSGCETEYDMLSPTCTFEKQNTWAGSKPTPLFLVKQKSTEQLKTSGEKLKPAGEQPKPTGGKLKPRFTCDEGGAGRRNMMAGRRKIPIQQAQGENFNPGSLSQPDAGRFDKGNPLIAVAENMNYEGAESDIPLGGYGQYADVFNDSRDTNVTEQETVRFKNKSLKKKRKNDSQRAVNLSKNSSSHFKVKNPNMAVMVENTNYVE
jgi:hypothetical protein